MSKIASSLPREPQPCNQRGTGFSLCTGSRALVVAIVLASCCHRQNVGKAAALDTQQDSTQAGTSKPAETEKNAAQIELLETKHRFETNGDSRKEVHTRVRINNELGARQFARLNFDFNRSFQAVEIPQVQITHAGGGIVDILPSAITDNPNPAAVDAPAYQEVRVKSIRILGLQPGDLLEYRVITTTAQHPLAPDFWLDHTFDRSGVVSEEIFLLDLPVTGPRIEINPRTPVTNIEKSETRAIYRWDLLGEKSPARESSDVAITTFSSWEALAERIESKLRSTANTGSLAQKKASALATESASEEQRMRASYDFVSQKIQTVRLPLGATAFQPRNPDDILVSGYATAEDKYVLLHRLALGSLAAMTGTPQKLSDELPRPSLLSALVVVTSLTFTNAGCKNCAHGIWLDPAIEVAPFGMLPASIRSKDAIADKKALFQTPGAFLHVPDDLPFPSTQRVSIDASLGPDGTLSAKVKYVMRGDNELLLRVAFHHSPKEKWKEVAQLLALSDGFRGQITNVTASDPYATGQPFTVEYEIAQSKFVDWSKKSLRIPALLPLPELPDAPPTTASTEPIKLGTPLAIELETTVHLPDGTVAQAPVGTSVTRDYATFSSKYSAPGNVLHASRSLHFILSELPQNRASDFNAFLHAVQSDQSQLFTLHSAVQK